MKTKYVLHGGFDPQRGAEQENDSFFTEVLNTAPEETNILLVYFAGRPERIPLYEESDIRQFNKNRGDRTVTFEVAEQEKFESQIEEAQVIYFHGGMTEKILETIKQFTHLKSLFSNKIIAADSAGANVLCSVFYSKRLGIAGEGLGLLPIKFIAHYTDQNKNVLDNIKPELETLFLSEYQYKVIYV